LELYYDFMYCIIILSLSYLATWLLFLNKPIDWLIDLKSKGHRRGSVPKIYWDPSLYMCAHGMRNINFSLHGDQLEEIFTGSITLPALASGSI